MHSSFALVAKKREKADPPTVRAGSRTDFFSSLIYLLSVLDCRKERIGPGTRGLGGDGGRGRAGQGVGWGGFGGGVITLVHH